MQSKGFSCGLGLMLALTSLASNGVEVIDHTEYYEIRGHTAESLAREMVSKGPQHPTGRRAWRYTDWRISSGYVPVSTEGGYGLEDVRISLTVVTTLPRWDVSGVPAHPRLKRDWAHLLPRIARQEAMHRAHGSDAAALAEQRIRVMPRRQDCIAAVKLARGVLELTSVSRAYDRETGFGRRDGVELR